MPGSTWISETLDFILKSPFPMVSFEIDEHQWNCLWSFAAGAGVVLLMWGFQVLRDAMPDEILADDSSWVEPWTSITKRSWKVIVEHADYYNNGSNSRRNSQSSAALDTSGRGEDYKHPHIGELPKKSRSHWPWETIRRRMFQEETPQESQISTATTETTTSRTAYSRASSFVTAEDFGDELLYDTESVLTTDNNDDLVKDDNHTSTPTTAREEKICIGSIFGMDVGGTLAKLVYFEEKPSDYEPLLTMKDSESKASSTSKTNPAPWLSRGASSTSNIMTASKAAATLSPYIHFGSLTAPGVPPSSNSTTKTSSSSTCRMTGETQSPPCLPTLTRRRSLSLGCLGRFKDLQRELLLDQQEQKHHKHHKHRRRHRRIPSHKVHASSPPKDQPDASESKHATRGSVQFADTNDVPKHKNKANPTSIDTDPTPENPTFTPMKKCQSMFNLSPSQQKAEALDRFYSFARSLDTYESSVRDHKLSFYSRELGGEFHFLHFESRWMGQAMDLIRYHQLHLHIAKMGATGGGAHKYAKQWDRVLGIQMDKQDELDSLVAGMQFVLSTVVGECYTFRPKTEDPRDGMVSSSSSVSTTSTTTSSSLLDAETVEDDQVGAPLLDTDDENLDQTGTAPLPPLPKSKKDGEAKRMIDEWWWSRKVQRDAISYSTSYPYLLVTIGTGVSVLRVDGPRKHERISGSTIGGGTYWGLIRLLTDVEDFDDVMKLAAKGDPAKVDMMVGDIYGENSDALEKLGLPSNIVASSFGKLVAKEDPAAGLTQEDLARALLLMITNNIGQVAYLNAKLHKTPRIYFVGNFLRRNMISQRRLSYAIQYWSKGEMEALFLEHEGYFGALGAFLTSQQISQDDGGFFQWGEEGRPNLRATNGGGLQGSKSNHSFMHRRLQTFGA